MSPDLPGDWFHGLVGDLYFPGNWKVSLPEKSKRRHVPQDSWEPRRVAHSCGPNEAEATVVNGKSAWGTYCPPLHLKTQQNRNWVGPQGLASLSTPSLAPCCLPFLPQNNRRLASGQTQTEFSLLSSFPSFPSCGWSWRFGVGLWPFPPLPLPLFDFCCCF